MTRRLSIPAVLAALALAAAGCGDDGDQKDSSAIDGDPATTLPKELASVEPAAPAREPGAPLPRATSVSGISTDLSKKPSVSKPTGSAPKELQGLDVVTGKGKEAKDGDTVSVQYVGVLFKDAKQFDTSWGAGKKPFEFTIGQGQVIAGWDEGLPGMKVGGRRALVIPADKAYGAQGSPPNIGPNEPLVFVIDLKQVK